MILLTKLEHSPYCGTVDQQTQELNETVIGIDPWSILTVEKFLYNGGSVGSQVYIGDGRGFIAVKELMTDVMHMVECAMKVDNDAN